MSLPLARLGSVVEIERKGVDPRAITPGTSYVGLEHISGDGTFVDVPIVQPGDLASTKFAFSERHVLFGKLRPYLRKTVRPDFSGVCSTDIIPVAPSRKLDRNYLFHFLRTDAVVNRATSMASGVNLPRISPKHLIEFEIPLPPLDEQRRIAAILDQADVLRRKRREALERLDGLKKSLLDEIVRNPKSEMTATNLGSCVDEFRYGTSEKATGTGFPVLRIPNVVGSAITIDDLKHVPLNSKEAERLRLRNGDLLFVRTNGNREYVGRSAVVTSELGKDTGLAPTDFVYASYLIRARLRPESVDATYLQAYLSGSNGRKAILERAKTSAGQFNINIESLASIPVELPSIQQQRRFSQKSREIDSVAALYRVHLNHLDSFFASLQYRAFRGEL